MPETVGFFIAFEPDRGFPLRRSVLVHDCFAVRFQQWLILVLYTYPVIESIVLLVRAHTHLFTVIDYDSRLLCTYYF